MSSLLLNIPLVVYNGLTVGGLSTDFFAIPPSANIVVWSVTYGGAIVTADIALHGSLDNGATDQHIDSDNSAVSFVRQVVTAAPFVAVHMDTIDEDVPIVIELTAKRIRAF